MENENNDINEKEVELNDFQFFKNEILSHLQQLDKSFSLKKFRDIGLKFSTPEEGFQYLINISQINRKKYFFIRHSFKHKI